MEPSFQPKPLSGTRAAGFSSSSTTAPIELAGIMDLVTVLPNQPSSTAILNNSMTYIINVASYRSALLDAIPEPSTFRTCLSGLLVAAAALLLRRRAQATRESR